MSMRLEGNMTSTSPSPQNEESDEPAPPSSSSSLLDDPAPKSRREATIHYTKHLGWWWELGAVFVSLVCMALIVAILFRMDGKPLQEWKLPIQPNSLVAIFSTITKSALLVPIAESIGQLKWNYFHDRQRTVQHMQIFDEASRGPWGALALLYKTRGRVVLAAFASTITVLMLAFQPFTQQIIAVHSEDARMFNTSGYVYQTHDFLPNSFGMPGDIFVATEIGILSTLFGRPIPSSDNTHCPTSDCRRDNFSSLAVCTTCNTAPIGLVPSDEDCYYQIGQPVNYTQTLNDDPSYWGGPLTFLKFTTKARESDEGSVWKKVCPLKDGATLSFQVTPRPGNRAELPVIHYNKVNYTYPAGGGASGFGYPSAIAWFPELDSKGGSGISACAVGLNQEQAVTTIFSSQCVTTSFYSPTIEKLDTFGVMNATVTNCKLELCVRRYQKSSVSAGVLRTEKTTDIPLIIDEVLGSNLTTAHDGSSNKFSFGIDHLAVLKDIFLDVLDFPRISLPIGPFYTTEWTLFFENIANAYTKVIQSPLNPDAKRINMEAYRPVIFVRVRWIWLILPLSLVIASNVLLYLTILRTRKRTYLFKNSILATLFHGLDGWESHELVLARAGWRETHGDMTKTAKGMIAVLKEDEDGYLKLKRQ